MDSSMVLEDNPGLFGDLELRWVWIACGRCRCARWRSALLAKNAAKAEFSSPAANDRMAGKIELGQEFSREGRCFRDPGQAAAERNGN